jgi:hypothetical protein
VRSLILALSFALSLATWSAAAQERPPKLEPLPEPPPPPVVREGADEPRVVIPQQGEKVEEYREGGRIVMLKVTPPHGVPYYLIDTTGNGNWMRRDSLDPGIRVPMWTIKTFD